jgi:hypothetical protein
MEQTTRNKLRAVVTQCRRLLEESVRQELEGKFGVYARDGAVHGDKPDAAMPHLTADEQAARRDILAHLGHIKARGFGATDALDQLVREVAFTHLNRLCAYKMMDARQVYVGGERFYDAVGKGYESKGVKFYLADRADEERLFGTGQQYLAYRHFLDWLGGQLSGEIGVLFSPDDPANRLYPSETQFKAVLDLINDPELADIWSQDETIGWVYQYFTPKELRDQARKESQAPRNSYELAFRNQFFTPRYVVEFLTDNTLGRVWYEMRQGRTRLADVCRYMVRPPDEVFLSRMTDGSEEAHSGIAEAARLLAEGTEETFPPYTGRGDDVQRMIDMAHTVSAFDRHGDRVFEIWNWDDGPRHAERMGELSTQFILDWLFMTCRADRHGGVGEVYSQPWFVALANEVRRRALAARNPDLKAAERLRLPAFIPYRAKKDPRELKILDPACGSGHFLLYCFDLLLLIYEEAYGDPDLGRALQESYPTVEEFRKAVPGLILKHNLHGIDIDLRATQIAALALWLRCQRAYQDTGLKRDRPLITRSNFVCAEPMPGEQALRKDFVNQVEPKLLGQLVEVVFDKMKLAGEAGSLLKIEVEIRDAVAEAKRQFDMGGLKVQMTLFDEPAGPAPVKRFDVKSLTDDQFFEQAEGRVVESLQRYAETAQNGHRLQRRLFSEDAVRGFAFAEVCQKKFDVVLMNPPFGESSKPAKGVIEKHYPRTKNDLYAAFVERGLDRLHRAGMLGAITSRTGFFLTSFQKWREDVLLREAEPTVFADLGQGVLDTAMVETAAYCLRKCW